jgi:two-component system nitrogen regulation response regulator GlnG
MAQPIREHVTMPSESVHDPRRIWVVDDDRSVRFVLATALRDAGYDVDGFENAAAALDALGDRHVPDLLFTDVRMPGDDGLVLLDKLKHAHPQLPVIVMSAYTDVASTAGAFRGGAHEFLSKPFDLDDAVALAARVAGGRGECGPDAGVAPAPSAVVDAAPQLIGDTPAMRALFRAIGRLAQAPLSVLITGETGTGKELVANALHRESPRARAFVALNTAAIPAELLKANCSATRPAHSPARPGAMSAASSRPTAARCSSTRSATCRRRCRRACCGCWPRASSSASAGAS